MPSNADIIEKLARQLERYILLNDLLNCKNLDDFSALTDKYKAICEEQER